MIHSQSEHEQQQVEQGIFSSAAQSNNEMKRYEIINQQNHSHHYHHHNINVNSINNTNDIHHTSYNDCKVEIKCNENGRLQEEENKQYDNIQHNSFESEMSKGDNDYLIDNKEFEQSDIESKQSHNSSTKQFSQNLQDSIQKAALAISHTSSNDQYLNAKDIKLLSFLVFCVNYGFSIEMVFISPFFFKVNTPDILDTLIWLIPPIVEKLLLPYISIPLKKRSVSMLKYRKLFVLLFSGLSIVGLLLMGFSRYITANWITLFDDTKTSIMFLGIFGFVFQDIGHDIIMMIVNQYSSDCVRDEDQEQCEYQFAFASSGGKITAFLISSVLAFNIEIWDVQNFMENLTFSYTVGALLLLFAFLYSFKGLRTNQMRITYHQGQESLTPVYNLNTILPSFSELQNMVSQQKYLVLSHFLMCGNLLLINIYATLWMGVTLQQTNMRYNVDSNKLRDYLFDLGISWGALVLCIAAFLYFFSTRYILTLTSARTNKLFLFASNFALNLSFIYTYFTENFYSSCLSLLLWGVAQAAFDSIPPKLCAHLELHNKINSKVSSELLEISLFFCQILFWFLMPAIFLMFQEFLDDISFSLFQGSFFGLIGSILVLFIQ